MNSIKLETTPHRSVQSCATLTADRGADAAEGLGRLGRHLDLETRAGLPDILAARGSRAVVMG